MTVDVSEIERVGNPIILLKPDMFNDMKDDNRYMNQTLEISSLIISANSRNILELAVLISSFVKMTLSFRIAWTYLTDGNPVIMWIKH